MVFALMWLSGGYPMGEAVVEMRKHKPIFGKRRDNG